MLGFIVSCCLIWFFLVVVGFRFAVYRGVGVEQEEMGLVQQQEQMGSTPLVASTTRADGLASRVSEHGSV